jgi:toxin HigB-1
VNLERILVDTGPLVALLRPDDASHQACIVVAQSLAYPFFTSWPVITEAAWLLRKTPGGVSKLLEQIGEKKGTFHFSVDTRSSQRPPWPLDNNSAWRYYSRMIRSFRDKQTENVFRRESKSKFARPLRRVAVRKLLLLDAAESLDDLRVPPGNRLEKLSGDRAGQNSIRINAQWRLCFQWENGSAHEVEIADYH